MLPTRCPDLAATSSFTAAASICREFLSTFLAGPVLDSLSESARQVASPGQVSCGWWTAGHVTSALTLIGAGGPPVQLLGAVRGPAGEADPPPPHRAARPPHSAGPRLGNRAVKEPSRSFIVPGNILGAFSLLKATTSAFTFKNLLRHYAPAPVTTRSMGMRSGGAELVFTAAGAAGQL